MKKSCTSTLILFLSLIIANTGFARADIQLCQAECEYAALNKAAPPPCCKSKKTVTPVMVMVDHSKTLSGDCPHFGSNREITDPLSFISSSSTYPTPQHVVLIIPPINKIQIPDNSFPGYSIRSGLSPPGIKIRPLYNINCSFLI